MQWLIDIIQEWVIAQAYATIVYVDAEIAALRAWVEATFLELTDIPSWTNPLSVTGDLSPDVTCTYLRSGTYASKPYYRRLGTFQYIWWNNPDSQWVISNLLANKGTWFWTRTHSNVVGDYVAGGTATGTATVTLEIQYLKICSVDRGDPAVPDFDRFDILADGLWHDLDLSAIVPPGVSTVAIQISLLAAAANKYTFFRTKGNVNTDNKSYLRTQAGLLITPADIIVYPDENRIIEYQTSVVAWLQWQITVKGWWF